MKEYCATYGVYVRAYTTLRFEAANAREAKKRVASEFRKQRDEIYFDDVDYTNMALPSLVSLQQVGTTGKFTDRRDIEEGRDFALNEADARDLASTELYNALRACVERLETLADAEEATAQDKAVLKQAKVALKKAETWEGKRDAET